MNSQVIEANINDSLVGEVVAPKEDVGAFRREKIAKIINTYLSALDDYRNAFAIAIPHVAKAQAKEFTKALNKVKKFSTQEIEGELHLKAEGAHASSELSESLRELERLEESHATSSLIRSMFIGMFSEYDSFVGHLLKALYEENQNLLKGISREITLTELLDFSDLETVKLDMLNKEIDSFRRESYSSQFAELERKFSIATLRNFDEWPEFVEISQRRNLFTHNAGHASQQYFQVCHKEKCVLEENLKVGAKLEISIEYYFRAIFILSKVGFMLAHTLWKKALPNKGGLAGDAMNDSIFLLLMRKRWRTAYEFGLFGLAETQIKGLDDITRKIRVINTSIGLKRSGKKEQATKLLDSEDWSACIRDLKLGKAILKEEYLEAASLMREIGKQGEILNQISYHTWPIFEDFRDKEEFQNAYETIYGISFIKKTSEEAQKRSQQFEEKTITETTTIEKKKLEVGKKKPKLKPKKQNV